jgi:hypothetical protein
MDRATPIIDFHVHFLVRDVLEQCLPHSVATNRGHHILPPHLFALFEKMMTPQGLIGDMDRLQIDMSVISSAAVIEPIYWAEPSVGPQDGAATQRYRRGVGGQFAQAHHWQLCPSAAGHEFGDDRIQACRRRPWP